MKPTLLLAAALLTGTLHAQTDARSDTPCKTLAPDAQDALIASPANHTVLFEDADVRVLDVHSQPHTREAVHTHRLPSVMYIERQGAGTYDTPDGTDHRSHPTDPNFKPRVIPIKASEGPHWTENTGDVPFHAIRVEFKHPGCGLPGWKPATSAPDDILTTAPENNTLLFENAEVRVLDVRLPPHARDPFHTHPWPGLSYIVQPSTVRYTHKDGSGAVLRTFSAAGTVQASKADGHAAENTGDTPLHVIRFELKYASPSAP